MKLFRRGDQGPKAAKVFSAIRPDFACNLTQTNRIYCYNKRKEKQQGKDDDDIGDIQSSTVIKRYDTGEILAHEVCMAAVLRILATFTKLTSPSSEKTQKQGIAAKP